MRGDRGGGRVACTEWENKQKGMGERHKHRENETREVMTDIIQHLDCCATLPFLGQ